MGIADKINVTWERIAFANHLLAILNSCVLYYKNHLLPSLCSLASFFGLDFGTDQELLFDSRITNYTHKYL